MKPDQRFTPKYWVFHNKETDDVYLDTAAKSWDGCTESVESLYLDKLMDFYENSDSPYEISLVEIRLWVDEEPYKAGILATQSKIHKKAK